MMSCSNKPCQLCLLLGVVLRDNWFIYRVGYYINVPTTAVVHVFVDVCVHRLLFFFAEVLVLPWLTVPPLADPYLNVELWYEVLVRLDADMF